MQKTTCKLYRLSSLTPNGNKIYDFLMCRLDVSYRLRELLLINYISMHNPSPPNSRFFALYRVLRCNKLYATYCYVHLHRNKGDTNCPRLWAFQAQRSGNGRSPGLFIFLLRFRFAKISLPLVA
jgi:hypothetical protein